MLDAKALENLRLPSASSPASSRPLFPPPTYAGAGIARAAHSDGNTRYLPKTSCKISCMQQIRTTVTRRWQTVVPAQIRKTLQVKEGDKLVWISDGTSVRVVVLPANPVAALRGIAKGERLYDKLLEARREERARER